MNAHKERLLMAVTQETEGLYAERDRLLARIDAFEQAATEALSLMRWEHWDKDASRPDKRAAAARLAAVLGDDDGGSLMREALSHV